MLGFEFDLMNEVQEETRRKEELEIRRKQEEEDRIKRDKEKAEQQRQAARDVTR